MALGQTKAALDYFTRARDSDHLRFRADTQINAIIREVANTSACHNVRLLDAENAFCARDDRVPGYHRFYDHVHFNITGNYQMTLLLKNQVETIFKIGNQDTNLSESECRARLALTCWDAYRMQNEMLERMKSPVFSAQLDHAHTIHVVQSQVNSLGAMMTGAALEEAVECYRSAIMNDADDWVLQNNFGLLLLEAVHDPARAKDRFRHILQLFPDDYLTLNNLGLAYAQQGSLNAAAAAYGKAMAVKPEFPESHFNLGEVYERQLRYKDALNQYEQSHLPPEQLARAFNRAAVYLAERNHFEQAGAHFERALTIWPASPEIETNYGLALCNQGAFEQGWQRV